MHILFECITLFAQIIWICKDDLSISSEYSNPTVNNVTYRQYTSILQQKIASLQVVPVKEAPIPVINQTTYTEELQIESPKVLFDIGVTTQSYVTPTNVRNISNVKHETNLVVMPPTNITNQIFPARNNKATINRGVLSMRPLSFTNKTFTRTKLVYLFLLNTSRSKAGNTSGNIYQQSNVTPILKDTIMVSNRKFSDSLARNQSFIYMTNSNGPIATPSEEAVVLANDNLKPPDAGIEEVTTDHQEPSKEGIEENQDATVSSRHTRGVLFHNIIIKTGRHLNITSSGDIQNNHHNVTDSMLSMIARSFYKTTHSNEANSSASHDSSSSQTVPLQIPKHQELQIGEDEVTNITDNGKPKHGDIPNSEKS